mmetsp:Transcript_19102/g.48875  ORF Transcript_19102/g.48875 Transcript_19102/m.48875 type:complete len:243 (-) Transcript_19102:1828-2556(-)
MKIMIGLLDGDLRDVLPRDDAHHIVVTVNNGDVAETQIAENTENSRQRRNMRKRVHSWVHIRGEIKVALLVVLSEVNLTRCGPVVVEALNIILLYCDRMWVIMRVVTSSWNGTLLVFTPRLCFQQYHQLVAVDQAGKLLAVQPVFHDGEGSIHSLVKYLPQFAHIDYLSKGHNRVLLQVSDKHPFGFWRHLPLKQRHILQVNVRIIQAFPKLVSNKLGEDDGSHGGEKVCNILRSLDDDDAE